MLNAIKYGESLPNSDLWKFLQLTLNIAAVWLPVLALTNPHIQQLLDAGMVTKLTSALATTNAYLTLATSTKIGV
jgi:hypothetical protein